MPFGLRPADDPLLLTQWLPVPDLDRHVDPAHHKIGAAGQPLPVGVRTSRHPYVRIDGGGFLGFEVHRAVFESHQIPRRLLTGRRGGRPTKPQL